MHVFPNCDHRFQALLADFDGGALGKDPGTIYGIWPDYALAYFNQGWPRFAELNGGEPRISSNWGLGQCVTNAISQPLRPLIEENFERCLRERRPWEHLYECSSADRFRLLHMTTFPLGDGKGLLVVNSLRQEAPHIRISFPPLDELYRNECDSVLQCSHCRRVRRIGEDPVWDWVPDWVATQALNTSHGLGEPCIGFHYPLQRISDTEFIDSFKTGF